MIQVKFQLLELETIANSKGLLDVSEVKKLHAQGPLEEELASLEMGSMEWFQDEAGHAQKLKDVYDKAAKLYKAGKDKKNKANDGWSTAARKR